MEFLSYFAFFSLSLSPPLSLFVVPWSVGGVCVCHVLKIMMGSRFLCLVSFLISHRDDDCVPFGNFPFNQMDGCRKSNRLLLSLRFCCSIKSTNENKRNDQFSIKRVANADGMVLRTQSILCWIFRHIKWQTMNAVSLLRSDNKPLVSAFVLLVCEIYCKL